MLFTKFFNYNPFKILHFFLFLIVLQAFQLPICLAMEPEDEGRVLSTWKRISIEPSSEPSQPLVHKHHLQDFAIWVNQDVLIEPEVLKKQKVAKWIGISVGLLGSVVFYDLGSGLAEEIVNNTVFKSVTGVTSAIPIAILGSQFCSHIFQEWARVNCSSCSTMSEEEKKITIGKSCGAACIRRGAQIFEGGLALISAAPITYLTNKYYYPRIGYAVIALDIPAFVAKTVSDYWAMDNTAAMLINSGKNFILRKKYEDLPDDVQHKRFDLINTLAQASHAINGINEIDADAIYNSLVKESDSHEQIKKIFYPSDLLTEHENQKSCQSWGRTAIGALGGVIGAFSSICLVPLAEESMASFLPAIGINSPIANKACGWIAGVAAGSLMTYATKESFERFYDFFAALPKYCRQSENSTISCRDVARVAAAGGASILGAYSAAPQAYLSEQYIGSETPLEIFTLVCSVVGPFAMDFWAIDSFFKGFLDQLSPKQRLLFAIEKIQNKILSLDDQIIHQLHDQVCQDKSLNLNQ